MRTDKGSVIFWRGEIRFRKKVAKLTGLGSWFDEGGEREVTVKDDRVLVWGLGSHPAEKENVGQETGFKGEIKLLSVTVK